MQNTINDVIVKNAPLQINIALSIDMHLVNKHINIKIVINIAHIEQYEITNMSCFFIPLFPYQFHKVSKHVVVRGHIEF